MDKFKKHGEDELIKSVIFKTKPKNKSNMSNDSKRRDNPGSMIVRGDDLYEK